MGDTIEQVVGQEIRRLREAAGIGQSALAAAARKYGLPWTRATIAAVELGRRRLSLGELAVIPLVLVEADVTGGIVLTLNDLIPVEERPVDVGPGLQLPLNIARALLLGEEDERMSRASATPINVGVNPRALEAAGDAEQKAAIALRVSSEAVVRGAHRLWGRSLTAERDRRVDADTNPDQTSRPEWPRRLQALRGHVTRALLEELRPLVKGVTKGKRSRP